MATTRPVAPTQARGEAGIGGVKQKKTGVADGRNRKALGDIQNLQAVRGNEGKIPAQISRPITRSFCAQLLANAQAAAAAENNKKQVCVKVNAGVPAELPKVAAQRRVAVRAKPKEVIEISPDTEEQELKAKAKAKNAQNPSKQEPQNRKKDGEGSAMRKKTTFSSVLSARSKAACGLENKPKEQIVDIDAGDVHDELAAVEYIEDIYKFYKEVEKESCPSNYMISQPDINEKMRSILVDWLIEIHNKFELMPETLYLTINIIDRFLSVKAVPRKELQLLGMGALLMASKYEEIWAPEVNDIVCIADRAYSHEQVLAMEKTILGKLEWTLTVPTHYVFLVRFIKASLADKKMENMAYFLAELGLMNYATLAYLPSMLAASAVYAARSTLNITPAWNETLKLHTGFSEKELMECAKLLVSYHSKAKENKLQVVYRKYSNTLREAVASIPPAKDLLADGGHESAGSWKSSSV